MPVGALVKQAPLRDRRERSARCPRPLARLRLRPARPARPLSPRREGRAGGATDRILARAGPCDAALVGAAGSRSTQSGGAASPRGHEARGRGARSVCSASARSHRGCSPRPGNLRDGAAAVAERSLGSSVSRRPTSSLRCTRSTRPTTLARVSLWDVRALRASYRAEPARSRRARRASAGFRRSDRSRPRSGGRDLPPRRQHHTRLVLDPLLPDAICPGDERRSLVEALRRYDRLGRTAWAGIPPPLRRPAHPHALDSHLAVAPRRARRLSNRSDEEPTHDLRHDLGDFPRTATRRGARRSPATRSASSSRCATCGRPGRSPSTGVSSSRRSRWLRSGRNPLFNPDRLFVIGARQLGLAVIMHDASHRSFFRSRALNDFAGTWLAAYPIWSEPPSVSPVSPPAPLQDGRTGGSRPRASSPRFRSRGRA